MRALGSGFQGGCDLGGMVRIVIDNGHIAHCSLVLEPPVGSGEGSKSAVNRFIGEIQLTGDGDGRQCVGNIMKPRHFQGIMSDVFHPGKIQSKEGCA